MVPPMAKLSARPVTARTPRMAMNSPRGTTKPMLLGSGMSPRTLTEASASLTDWFARQDTIREMLDSARERVQDQVAVQKTLAKQHGAVAAKPVALERQLGDPAFVADHTVPLAKARSCF